MGKSSRLWDSIVSRLGRTSRKLANRRKKLESIKARSLQLEQCEDRLLLSIAPISGPASVDENELFTLTVDVTDLAATDTVTEWTIDWGDETVTVTPPASGDDWGDGVVQVDSDTWQFSHSYPDGSANYYVQVDAEITDEFDNTTTDSSYYPRIPGDANMDGVVDSADQTIFNVNNGATNATWDMGDFNGDETVDTSDGTILTDHLSQSVNSSYGGITVNNVAPTLAITGNEDVNEGSEYSITLSASDPGDDAISSWTINWGDGTTSTGTDPGDGTSDWGNGITANADGTWTATHTYADDGDYVVTASATDEDGTWDVFVPGQLDTRFGTDGMVLEDFGSIYASNGFKITQLSDGELLVTGYSASNFFAAKYLADGTLDTTFGGGDGLAVVDLGGSDWCCDASVLSDGKIVLVGKKSDSIAVVRLNADGTLDTTFNTTGIVTESIGTIKDIAYCVIALPDDSIIVGGTTQIQTDPYQYDAFFIRYDSTGARDMSFGDSGLLRLSTVEQYNYSSTNSVSDRSLSIETLWNRNTSGGSYDPTDHILVAALDFHWRNAVVFFDASGNLVTDFSQNGIVEASIGYGTNWAKDLAIDRGATDSELDDTILLCGYAWGGSAVKADHSLIRLKFEDQDSDTYADACVFDTTLDGDGSLWYDVDSGNDYAEDLTILPDGQIVVVGYGVVDGHSRPVISSHNWSDGSFVNDFGTSGKIVYSINGRAYDVVTDEFGNILVTGNLTDDGQSKMFVARFLTSLSGHNITVNNVEPTLTLSGDADVDEGSVYTLTLSASDVGDDTIFGWTVNWGDGTTSTGTDPGDGTSDWGNGITANADGTWTATHTYATGTDRWLYDITATATDEDGTSSNNQYQGNLLVSKIDGVLPDGDESDSDYTYGDLSLREALYLASQNAGTDTITFDPSMFTDGTNPLPGTITLGGTQLEVDSDVTITGPGAELLTIDGDEQSRVILVRSTEASLSDMTVAHGIASNGGAIYSSRSSLKMDRVVVLESVADSGGGGVLVYYGTAEINDSVILGNSAGHQGGGVCNLYGTVEINNTVVTGNSAGSYGGGVRSYYGTNNITNSTIAGNFAGAIGGGIRASSSHSITTVKNTIIALNTATTSHANVYVTLATGSTNNFIDSDPLFVRSPSDGGDGWGDDPSTTTIDESLNDDYGDLHLTATSPAINAGDNAVASGLTTDLDSNARIIYQAVDIGAYEYNGNILVSTLADESDGDYTYGDLSLREALYLASQTPEADTIEFDPSMFTDGTNPVPGTITLGGTQLTVDSNVTIEGPGADLLTIDADSDGDGEGDSRVFYVNGVEANFSDMTITGGAASSGAGIYADTDSNLTINDAIIIDNSATNYGGGVYVTGSTVEINNSTFSNNAAYGGGGFYGENNSVVEISGSAFTGSSATNRGGGVRLVSSIVDITDSEFSGNAASLHGGGLSMVWTEANVVNSSFVENTSSNQGGGIHASDSTLYVSGGSTFTDNEAGYGGGSFNYRGTISVLDATFSGNSATGNGGGMHSSGDVTISQSTFTGNTATNNGGGIRVVSATADITDSTFSGNTANDGGGMSIGSSSSVEIVGTTFSNNTATDDGGGIYADGGSLIIGSTDFSSNSATYGGGVSIRNNSSLEASYTTTFSNNIATAQGGGIYSNAATLNVSDSTFTGNESQQYGGGMMVSTGTTFDFTNLTITGNSATSYGGGIEFYNATGSISGSAISNNTSAHTGGGIYAAAGSEVTIANSTVSNNTTTYSGGGVCVNNSDSTANITNSIFTGNTARDGGAIAAVDNSIVNTSGSEFSENTATNQGGGIFGNSSTLNVSSGSTFMGNSSIYGGGLFLRNGAEATVANSAFFGNTASSLGGGIYADGGVSALTSVALINSTVTSNDAASGGGLYRGTDSNIASVNTIIALNTATSGPDIYGSLTTDSTNNLIGDGTGQTGLTDGVNGNQLGTTGSPLDPLFVRNPSDGGDGWGDDPSTTGVDESLNNDYGDLRLTATSPAINAGDNTAVDGLTTDIDGNARVIYGTVDIGAYEYNIILAVAGDASVDEGSACSITLSSVEPGNNTITDLTIDWGDGKISTGTVPTSGNYWGDNITYNSATDTWTATHVYADNPSSGDTYTITATASNAVSQNAPSSTSHAVSIYNIAPEISRVNDMLVSEGSVLDFFGMFTDPGFENAMAGTTETFSYVINWGDEQTNSGTPTVTMGVPGIATTGSFSATHNYATSGIYTVEVTVTDDDGGSSTQYFQVYFGIPLAPTNFSATAVSVSQIDLNWTDNASSETAYKVDRSIDNSNWTEIVQLGANVTSYTDTSLVEGTTYYYRVYATNSIGNSASVDANNSILPAAPTNLTVASIGNGKLIWNWEDNSSREGYYVIEQLIGDDWLQIGSAINNSTSATISNLTFDPLASYSFRVRARGYSSEQYSLPSNVETITMPAWPEAPTTLTATAISASQITLNWTDNADNETGYQVERSLDDNTWEEIAQLSPNVTTYSDTSLIEGTRYYYRICATGVDENSLYISTSNWTLPEMPTNLTIDPISSNQLVLNWSDNSNKESSYVVEQLIGSNWHQIGLAPGNSTNVTISNRTFEPSTSYSFRVRAYSNSSESYSLPSNTITDTTTAWPVSPTNLVATTVSDSRIDLSWTDNASNESAYKIERSLDNSTWSEISQLNANATSYSDTGLSEGTVYYYRVYATNLNGDSASCFASNTTLPTSPTNLTINSIACNQLVLNWNDNSSAENSYSVQQLIDGTWQEIGSPGANSTSATISDRTFESSTSYSFRVLAYSSTSDSYSLPSNIATEVTSAWPNAPTDLTVTPVSDSQINLNWTDNADNETAYKVERSLNNSTWTEIAVLGADTTSCSNSGLSDFTTYYYRVRAVNGNGSSPYITASTTTELAAPTNLTIDSISQNLLELSWEDNSAKEARYFVEQLVDGTWQQMVWLYPNNTSATISNRTFEPSTTYNFRVRAYNNNIYSSPTNTATVTTVAWAIAPTDLTATASSDSQIDLAWTDNADNETTYKVERSLDDSTWSEIAQLSANADSYSDTGLTEGILYYYRVCAVNGNGNSEYASIKSAILVSPTNLTVHEVDSSHIELHWQDNSNVESQYRVEEFVDGNWISRRNLASNTTSVVINGLTSEPSESHSFRVRAYKSINYVNYCSLPSNTETITTAAWPNAPTNLTITPVSDSQIDLSWTDNADNETAYKIERSLDNSTWTEITLGANATSYSDSGLAEFTYYYYRVYAINGDGPSLYITASARTELAAPTNLSVDSISQNLLELSWEDNSGSESQYLVEQLVNGTWQQIAWPYANSTNATITNRTFEASTSYSFRIRARYSSYSYSQPSIETIVTPAWPEPPASLAATALSPTQINLSWSDASSNETGFKVERSLDNSTWTEIAQLNANESSYIDTGLTEGTRYYYRVYAISDSGDSIYSYANSTTQPIAPTNLVVDSISRQELELHWQDNSNNESSYVIEHLVDGEWEQIRSVTSNVTSATVTNCNFEPLTVHSFRVRAYDPPSHSLPSNTATITTAGWPADPTDLTLTAISDSQIDLNWVDNASNEAFYKIERSPNNWTWTEIAQLNAGEASYSDTGLASGTRYYYRIYAVNGTGESAYSNTENATTSIVPSNLMVTSISSNELVLHWEVDSQNNATYYYIEQLIDGTWQQIGSLTGYNKTGITIDNHTFAPSTSYSFRLYTRSSNGIYSPFSNIETITTGAWPVTPTNLTAVTVSDSQIDLSWSDNADNENVYKVERSLDNSTWTEIAELSANITSYGDTGLTEGTGYYYRVYAINNRGNSSYAQASNTTNLAAPTNLAIDSLTGSEIIFSWEDNSDHESRYYIEKLNGDTWQAISTPYSNTTSVAVSNHALEPSTEYCFRVRAYFSSSSYSLPSNIVTITTPAWPVAPTSLTLTTASSSQIDLGWGDNADNENAYKVERSLDNSTWTEIAELSSNATSYSDTGLSEGTRYYYRVYAANGNEDSGYISANAFTQPVAPTNLTIDSISCGVLVLNWEDNSTKEYRYSVEQLVGDTWQRIATPYSNSTSVTISNRTFEPLTEYSFRVRAYNYYGIYSEPTNIAAITTAAWPVAPTGLMATATSDSQIELAWVDNADSETSYKVERSLNNSTWSEIAELGANAASYSDTGLTEGIRYYYRVSAVNGNGNSAFASIVSATQPTAPTNLTIDSISARELSLSWSDNTTKEYRYSVEQLVGDTWQQIATPSSNSTSATISNLAFEPSTEYSFRVRAHSSYDVYSLPTNVGTITTAAWPIAPNNLAATMSSSSQVSLIWTDNVDNDSAYKVERSLNNSTWTEIAELEANVTTYSDPGLAEGTTYYYRVYAVNENGSSVYSQTSIQPSPTAPTNLFIDSISSNELTLNWQDNSAKEYYYYVEQLIDGTWHSIANFSSNSTNATVNDQTFEPSTTYSFRVRAYNYYGGYSLPTNIATITTAAWPVAPAELIASTVSASQIDLIWNDNANNETGYKIERSLNNSDWSEVAQLGADTTCYRDTGLAEGTRYYYRISAYNGNGSSVCVSTNCTTQPLRPTNLTIDSISGGELVLSWDDNSAKEHYYYIERLIDGTWHSIASFSSNSTNVTISNQSFESSTTYSFRVRAIYYGGYSLPSNTVTVTTPAWPVAPTDLTVTAASDSQIDLSWTDNTNDETGYKIERRLNNSDWSEVVVLSSDITSYSDAGLDEGTGYYYRVSSVNGEGASAYANVYYRTLPVAPTNLLVESITGSEISLSWLDHSDVEQSYQIQRAIGSSDWTTIGAAASGTDSISVTIPGVFAPSSEYRFRVLAYDSVQHSVSSNIAVVTTDTWPLAPSSLIATTISNSQIDLAWSDNANDEIEYKIERTTNGNVWTQINVVTADTTVYSDTGLIEGIRYYYRISAANGYGSSAYATTSNATHPTAPTNCTIDLFGGDQLVLSWDDNSMNENGYFVYELVAGNWQQIESCSANTSSITITDRILDPLTTYSFRVYAYSSGVYSQSSNVAAVITPAWPATPVNLTAVPALSSQINLTWTDRASNETGYKIERSLNNSTWTQIAELEANITSYSDTGLAEGTTYYYRISVTNSDGNSAYVYTSSITLPKAPSNLTVNSIRSNELALNWEDNSTKEYYYYVEQLIDGTWQSIADLSSNSTYATINDQTFAPSTTYNFRVRAYNFSAGYSLPSNIAVITTAAWPVAPTGLTATTISVSQIDLAWIDNASNETGYKIERSLDNSTWLEIAQLAANASSYSDIGLDEGTKYYYRISAVNGNGNSVYVLTSNATQPVAPTNLTIDSISGSDLVLSWDDNSLKESFYYVEQLSGDTWLEIGWTNGDNTSVTISDQIFDPSTTYSFRVRAFCNDVYSLPTNTATIATAAWPLSPTELTAATVSGTQIELTWVDNATSEAEYRIERSINGGSWTLIQTVSANTTSYLDSGLNIGKASYSYRVTAKNAAGISAPSNIETILQTGVSISEIQTPDEYLERPGIFRVTRTGELSHSIVINYSVTGTAVAGDDYELTSGTILLPSGVDSTNIIINPIDDGIMESNESIILTLADGTGYIIDSGNGSQVSSEVIDGTMYQWHFVDEDSSPQVLPMSFLAPESVAFSQATENTEDQWHLVGDGSVNGEEVVTVTNPSYFREEYQRPGNHGAYMRIPPQEKYGVTVDVNLFSWDRIGHDKFWVGISNTHCTEEVSPGGQYSWGGEKAKPEVVQTNTESSYLTADISTDQPVYLNAYLSVAASCAPIQPGTGFAGWPSWGTLEPHVLTADLDVDSNNTSEKGIPTHSETEEEIEDTGTGKYIAVQRSPEEGTRFVPLTVKLDSAIYDASEDPQVKFVGGNGLKLWTGDVDDTRTEISFNTSYSASDLGFGDTWTTLYVEATSVGSSTVEMQFDALGDGDWVPGDQVKFTAIDSDVYCSDCSQGNTPAPDGSMDVGDLDIDGSLSAYLVLTGNAVAVTDPCGTLIFDFVNDELIPRMDPEVQGTMSKVGSDYVVVGPDGTEWTFAGSGFNLGQLLDVQRPSDDSVGETPLMQVFNTLESGDSAPQRSYDPAGRLIQEVIDVGSGGAQQIIDYVRDSITGQVTQETVSLYDGSTTETVTVTQYTYYGQNEWGGNKDDLKLVTVHSGSISGEVIEQNYYRYWGLTDPSPGAVKYVFGTASLARVSDAMSATGKDPMTASDADIAPYADDYFEYNSYGQVTSHVAQGDGCSLCGGQGGTAYEFTTAPATFSDGFNNWEYKKVETVSGRTTTTYYNYRQQELLKDVWNGETGGDAQHWYTYHQYDNNGNLVLTAYPSAVISYDDTAADLSVSLNASSGLIEVNEYYVATNAPEYNESNPQANGGGVKNYLWRSGVKNGASNSTVWQTEVDYIAKTVNNHTSYFAYNSTSYADDVASDPQVTKYRYLFFADTTGPTIRVQETILPEVETSKHGSGSNISVFEVLDPFGRTVWTQDAAGYISYTEYDRTTGAVIKQIADVDITNTSDFTSGNFALLDSLGWSTPSDGGKHLIATAEVDLFGRATKQVAPDGTITYTVYNDADRETRTYYGWDDTSNLPTGAIEVYREDLSGNYSEVLTFIWNGSGGLPVDGNGRPDGTESLTSSDAYIQSLSRSLLNSAGQATQLREYFSLDGLSYSTDRDLGTEGVNYLETVTTYDPLGRIAVTETPDGTVYQTFFDTLNRTTTEWIGTDDVPDTDYNSDGVVDLRDFRTWVASNPNATEGPAGTSMYLISANIYDFGEDCGDSLLTEFRSYFGSGATNYYTTLYNYDWQGYLTDIATPDNVVTHHDYDNLGSTTQTLVYADMDQDYFTYSGNRIVSTNPESAELRDKSTYLYDSWGRLYETRTYEVNPSSGVEGNYLAGRIWYDPRGLVAKTATANGLFTKYTYNSLGQEIASYLSYDSTELDTNYTAALGVDGDTVIEQTQSWYDKNGLEVSSASYQRLPDSTNIGALDATNSYTTATVYWYDAIGRVTHAAFYGREDIDSGSGLNHYFFDSSTGALIDNNGNGVPDEADGMPREPNTSDDYIVTKTIYNSSLSQTGTIIRSVDNTGRINEIQYDLLGREIRVIQNYDNGTVEETDTDKDATTEYEYDSFGRLVTLIAYNAKGDDSDPGNENIELQKTKYLHEPNLDGSWTATTIYPDSDDVLLQDTTTKAWSIITDNSDHISAAYDRQGRTISTTDQRGVIHEYTYDTAGRLSSDIVTLPQNSDVDDSVLRIDTAYDDLSRVETITSYSDTIGTTAANQIKYEYNGWGKVYREYQDHDSTVDGNTPFVQYNYEDGAAGSGIAKYLRLEQIVHPDSSNTLTYGYGSPGEMDDILSRVVTISMGATTHAAYTYLGADTIVTEDYVDSKVRLSYLDSSDDLSRWDRFGRVLDQIWEKYDNSGQVIEELDHFRYGYDRAGNCEWKENVVSGELSTPVNLDELYTYDGLDQLNSVQRGNLVNGTSGKEIVDEVFAQDWTLDGQGNWSEFDDNDTPQTREANEANEIDTITGSGNWITPEYDSAGNMISGPKPGDETVRLHYTYDAWNRLVEVRADDSGNPGDLIAEYGYDAQNRRINKENFSGGLSEMRHFYYNNLWRCIEERVDAATTADTAYIWGEMHVDEMVARIQGSTTTYVLHDANFNSTAITNDTGVVIERYAYSPYGEVSVFDASYGTQSSEINNWEHLYTGRRLDAETGLTYYRNRYYNVSLGQFISRDPIGYKGSPGNLYEYVESTPISHLDPFGLSSGKAGFTKKVFKGITMLVKPGESVILVKAKNGATKAIKMVNGKFADSLVTLDDLDRLSGVAKDRLRRLANRYGHKGDVSIRFDKFGQPDFSNYFFKKMYLKDEYGNIINPTMRGYAQKAWRQLAREDRATYDAVLNQMKKDPTFKCIWHHNVDGTLELVDDDLHRAFQHTGGNSVINVLAGASLGLIPGFEEFRAGRISDAARAFVLDMNPLTAPSILLSDGLISAYESLQSQAYGDHIGKVQKFLPEPNAAGNSYNEWRESNGIWQWTKNAWGWLFD